MQTIESVYQADTRLLSTELWEYVSKGLTDQRVLIKLVWPKYNQIPRHHHVTSWLLWSAKMKLGRAILLLVRNATASMGIPLLDLYISSFCIEKGSRPLLKSTRYPVKLQSARLLRVPACIVIRNWSSRPCPNPPERRFNGATLDTLETHSTHSPISKHIRKKPPRHFSLHSN